MTAEFVRRAERGLGVAIREGQERGEVLRQGEKIDRGANQYQSGAVDQMENTKPGPESFAPKGELHGSRGDGIYALTDNVSNEQFEEVITDAKSEGNLSRANVARKCKAKSKPAIDTEGPLAILAAILAGTPRLPDAACRQHVELFDRAADGDRDAAEEAVAICRGCPVLTACRDWLDSMPKPPPGVWAGTYTPPVKTRKARIA